MKTSQNYFNAKRETVELWFEEVNGKFDFWEKANGVSESISERQYLNRLKKHNLSEEHVIAYGIKK